MKIKGLSGKYEIENRFTTPRTVVQRFFRAPAMSRHSYGIQKLLSTPAFLLYVAVIDVARSSLIVTT